LAGLAGARCLAILSPAFPSRDGTNPTCPIIAIHPTYRHPGMAFIRLFGKILPLPLQNATSSEKS